MRYRFALILIVIALIGIAGPQNQPSRDILTRPTHPADHRIAYGNDPLQFGELRLPKGSGPHPVVVVIHGGCWMAEYGLSYMGHSSAALTEDGVATWNIEYRRVGNPGGGWPGTFQDVAQGIDHLRELAKTFPLDLNRVVALGHSAGGHLALWAAAQENLFVDLRGVVSLAGITDLQKKGTACDELVERLMNGSAEYSQTSPIKLLPLKIRQTIVQGEMDGIVPASMAREYFDAAKQKGEKIKLVLIENTGHFELVDPKSSAWLKVRDEVLVLLRSQI